MVGGKVDWGGAYVYNDGVADGVTVSAGLLRVSNGGVARNTIAKVFGSAIVYSGGVASDTIVSSGGTLVVSSGGLAVNVTSSAGATVTVIEGGTVSPPLA